MNDNSLNGAMEQKDWFCEDIAECKNKFTARDMVLRGWQTSIELVRDFDLYSKKVEDENVKNTLRKFAEEEKNHASYFRDLMGRYEQN